MNKRSYRIWLHWGSRILLGLVFLLAGVLKLLDLNGFRGVVGNYEALQWAAPAIVYGLPWLEVLCGAVLLIPGRSGGAWFLITVLLGAFLALNTLQWIQGKPPDCGCFGSWDILGKTHAGILLRNGLLLALAFGARPGGRELEAKPESPETHSP